MVRCTIKHAGEREKTGFFCQRNRERKENKIMMRKNQSLFILGNDEQVNETSFLAYSKETNISPRDPRWLGAWWLGFLVFGGSGLVVGIPLLFFPRSFRQRVELEVAVSRQKETRNHDNMKKQKFWWEFKGNNSVILLK